MEETEDRLDYWWYEGCYWATMTVMTLGFSLRIEGRRHVPRRGPVLILANHESFLDPIVLGVAIPRHVQQLARKTLFRNRFFGALLRSLHAFPVDQEGVAKEGLRKVLDFLRAGEAVVVFPEGERSFTGQIQPFKPGIHLLLRRAQVPVIPVGVAGAFEALPRTARLPRLSPLFLPATGTDVVVSIGRPVLPQRYTGLDREQLLSELFREVQAVQARAERLRRKA